MNASAPGEGSPRDSSADEALDRIARLAARVLRAPTSLINFIDVDAQRQRFRGYVGLPEEFARAGSAPLEYGLCPHVAQTGECLAVTDAREDVRFRELAVVAKLGVVAYLGQPIRTRGGEVLGVLSAIDRSPREWTETERAVLADLAESVVAEVEWRRQLEARAAAEAELERQRRRLEAAQRISRTGDWEWTPGAREVAWSTELYRVFGVEPGTRLTFEDYLGLVHEDDRERMRETIARALETGAPYLVNHRVVWPDGTVRHVHGRGEVERDADGVPTRVFGTAHDTTERVLVREALQETELRLQSILDHSPALVYAKDLEGRFLLVNRSFCELLGIRPEDALGRTAREVFSVPRGEEYAENDGEVLRSGQPLQFEETVESGDGRRVEVLSVKFPLRSTHGEVYAICGISTEITEWKRAQRAVGETEARFRALVENGSELIVVLAQDGTIRYQSPAMERVLGHRPEALEGRSGFDLVHPDDRAKAEATVAAAWEGAEAVTCEVRLRRKDGGYRVCLATASMVDAPAVGGVVVNARDVTALRESEAQLLQAQKMEAVGRLAGGVAHDFNNLLNVIGGNVELALLDLPEAEPLRADLEEVARATERASDLTRQLLAFGRRQILQPRVLDLNRVVLETGRMLRRLLGEDVEVVHALDPALGQVRVDPGQIEQVVMNLAVNARDAMPRGGTLTLETRNAELGESEAQLRKHPVEPGRYVVLSVSDTGEGIAKEMQEEIFEPFFTTKEQGKGTGLGLSTVYGIVKQSGGYLFLYSEPGQGSTFKIYLPRVDAPQEAPAGAPAELERGTGTILLVEDEAAMRSVARKFLERSGYRVLEAETPERALELAEQHAGEISLVLSDVVMPRMSGRELAERLRARWPGMKVLYMSGYTDDGVLRHGTLESGVAFLQKPFGPRELAAKLKAALAQP